MNTMRIHTTPTGLYRSQWIGITGLLDLSTRRASFGSYKALLGWKNERRARAFCRQLVEEMIKETVDRIIDQGDVFELPMMGRSIVHVGDLAAESSQSSKSVFPGLSPRERHNVMLIRLPFALAKRHARNGKNRHYRIRLEYVLKMRIQQRLDENMVYLDA